MDYQMEYIHEDENGEEIILDVEFSYKQEEFSIESATVQETGEETDDYDDDALMVKVIEHAQGCADSDAEDRAVDAYERKQYNNNNCY